MAQWIRVSRPERADDHPHPTWNELTGKPFQITDPQDDDGLFYDAILEKFINAPATAGEHEHDHITPLENNSFGPDDPITDYPLGASVFLFDWNNDPNFFGTSSATPVTVLTVHARQDDDEGHYGYQVAKGAEELRYRMWSTGASMWPSWVRINDFNDLFDLPSTFNPTTYTHTQSIPDTTWTVVHNLGRRPSGIAAIDSGNNVMYGGIQHIDDNSFLLTWSYAESGEVRVT